MKLTPTILLAALASTLPAFTPFLRGQTTASVTTIHSFGNGSDGSHPSGRLVLAGDHNLYGTTRGVGGGTVFSITPAGGLTTLHYFTNSGPDGANPNDGLIQDRDGNLYGTTEKGGANAGVGTVFQFSSKGEFTTLHTFAGPDGASPFAGLVQGSDGNFYGTTENGGSNSAGTVFQITPAGNFNSLHSFTGAATDGGSPKAGLIQGADGNLYGTTSGGGASGQGTAFSITPAGAVTILHSFSGPDGSGPTAALLQGADGYFYGTTYLGGSSGVGTVFRITSAGAFASLYSFPGGADGAYPSAALVQGADGNFYGATGNGGAGSDGTVFLITPAGALTTLHSFTQTGADGGIPEGGPVLGDNGAFFGTTSAGGSNNAGTVYRFSVVSVPTVSILSPPKDITIVAGSPLNITIDDEDLYGDLRDEEVTLNGVFLGGGVGGPDAFYAPGIDSFPLIPAPSTPGTYTLLATATDSAGGTGSDTRTFTVIPADADPGAPSSTLVTDLDGRKLAAGSTFTLTGQASTADGSPLQEVDFFANGAMVAALDANGNSITSAHPAPGGGGLRRTDAAAGNGPLFQTSYTVPGAGKQVSLLAVALSKLKTSQVSSAQTITPVAASVDRPPTLALSGLTDGQHLVSGQSYTVTTTVSPGTSALAQVQHYLNKTKISTVNPDGNDVPAVTFVAPAGGKYIMEAIGVDAAGVSSVAAPINVTVDPPVVTITVRGNGEAIEGGAAGKAMVERTGDTASALTVFYKVAGSAKSGAEYQPVSGSVTIPAGSSKAKIKIKPIDNLLVTGTLVAKIKLKASPDGSYQLGSGAVAKIKVLDND